MNLRHCHHAAPPALQLLWIVCVTLAFSCVTLVLSALLMQCSGLPADAWTDFSRPQTVAWLKALQGLQATCIFICPVLVLMALNGGREAFPDFFRRPRTMQAVLVAGIMLCLVPFINLTVAWNEQLRLPAALGRLEDWMQAKEQMARALTDAFLDTVTLGGLLVNTLVVCLLAAVGEEFLFRGALQPVLIRLCGGPVRGIVLTALFFSALHMQFYGFLPRWLLGMLFGFLAWRTRSVWTSVWAHFLNNFVAVGTAFQIHAGRWPQAVEEFGKSGDVWPVTAAATLAAAALIHFFWKRSLPGGQAQA